MSESKQDPARLLSELKRGDAFGVRFELASGADPNHCEPNGLSLLHLASRDGHAAVASALVEAGARLDAEDIAGDTPLHYAVAAEHVDVVDVLVAAGADPSHANRAGQRPVDLGSVRVRRHLLPNVFEVTGPNPSVRGS